MSILVTGGCGYIGSHMTWNLHDAGKDVVIIDNLSTGFSWLVPDGVPVIEGDIGDADLVAKVMRDHKVEAVIHFAGSIVVPDSVKDPLGYYFNNTVKSRSLIENAVKAGVKAFIFSSTAAVYGNPAETDKPLTEELSLEPISPYGTSKLMTELMLRDSAVAYGLKYAALRYFNVAGADPAGRTGQSTPTATHLIKVANQVALGQRDALAIFGNDYPTPDGTCIRDYIHVSDLVAAHALALDALLNGHEPFVANCGYGKGYSVLEVVEAVRRVSDVNFEAAIVPRRDGDPATLVADSSRLRSITGWLPQHDDLDLIVRTALDWERTLIEKGHNRA
ncbi:UDP-glucose 4-epimerase [Cohaesibacter sp. ES.047]|uniref:UDP-glucose 4-epimerase GalE n=1 Tax=Cohaesibacter sp. ES.047 TaxID=1798205 RepID=UPI000BB6B685|nr:UDP-glucose 4-epimerase GalE [Cohaesibacter sp. ES.047]SNY90104.1 UDP-glucose 4-epimerase [Cohaesibacter sp. ES.047]